MSKREEISDMIVPEAYDDPNFKKGLVLKFTKATLKLTKVDRKNKRVWAEHISLYDFNKGMSHYGHDVDTSDPARIYCNDCKLEISDEATTEGDIKATHRQDVVDEKEAEESRKKDKHRRFRYELLKQDGTIKEFPAQKRKKVGTIMKMLGAKELGVVPPVYYPQRYETAALYSDKDVDWDSSVRNPHLQTIPGNVEDGEPEEFFIVGDVLAEIEVTN